MQLILRPVSGWDDDADGTPTYTCSHALIPCESPPDLDRADDVTLLLANGDGELTVWATCSTFEDDNVVVFIDSIESPNPMHASTRFGGEFFAVVPRNAIHHVLSRLEPSC